jgi:hypothetical protein
MTLQEMDALTDSGLRLPITVQRKLLAVAEAAKAYHRGVEAQDMGFNLPSSIDKAPGSYWDLERRLATALADLKAP